MWNRDHRGVGSNCGELYRDDSSPAMEQIALLSMAARTVLFLPLSHTYAGLQSSVQIFLVKL